jgi:GTP-binding protein
VYDENAFGANIVMTLNVTNPAPTPARKSMVAIVGRQNVGKSTLLNRLAGRRLAIVEDLPGTTRDRLKADAEIYGREFTVVDTGGLETRHDATFGSEINRQIDLAINEADVILFVVDAGDGLLPLDTEVAALLRPVKKPVLLVVNKADNELLAQNAAEFYRLGLGDPIAVSAYHGRGINGLLDAIIAVLPQTTTVGLKSEGAPRLAIVGRPNVGKSALLNSLLGEERVVVSPIPGTTRDAIDTTLDFGGRHVILIDTAGIKKRGRIGTGIDRFSVDRSLKAIERSDIALLVLDATDAVTEQDLHIAGFVQQAYKGIVIVINKQDLVKDLNKNGLIRLVKGRLKFFSHAPVVLTSAVTGEGVKGIVPQALNVFQERQKRIPTAELNSAVNQAVAQHMPPSRGGKLLKLIYATQAEVNPPTFVFFVNNAKLAHFSYQRFLENSLRRRFGFQGTPLKFLFKSRGE